MTPIHRALLATVFSLSAGALHAQATPAVTQASIEAAYAGYERIEIAFGLTQVKVEAIDAETGQKIEAIYDSLTGAILKQEVYTVTGPIVAGTEVETRGRDFIKVRGSNAGGAPKPEDDPEDELEDEDQGDDHGIGHGADDSEDDDRGGKGGDDRADDDRGGKGGKGGDDRAGDDRGGKGGDDRGDDDHGDDHDDDHGDDDGDDGDED